MSETQKEALRDGDSKKKAERDGLVLLNEVQEYLAKCTFMMVHNSLCARLDFNCEMSHRDLLPIIEAGD